MDTWDDLAAHTNVTKEDRDLLIAIIAPDLDTLEQINHGNAFTYEIMLIADHRQKAADYWYRQGNDDGHQSTIEAIVGWLRETWRTDTGDIECLDIADAIEAGEYLK